MLSHLSGFNNEISPKNGIIRANVKAITANGIAIWLNKSNNHFNGVLNKLNSDTKFNSNGMKNNAPRIKFLNGIKSFKPSNRNNPKLSSPNKKSLNNLSPFAKTMIGFSNNPRSTGKKLATRAVNPLAIKNGKTAFAIGNVNNVNKPKLNKNNGNVRSPLRSGNNNKFKKSFNKLINGNANNVASNANGKPRSNNLATSPIVLNSANGIATKALNKINGSRNGANNNPNPGINNANVASKFTRGSNNKLNRSNGKFPSKSLRTSANASGNNNKPSGNNNGAKIFKTGINGNNKLNNPNPSNLRRSNGNLMKCLINLPNSDGNSKPAKIANGNPSKWLPKNTRGNSNRSNNNLIGKIGNAANNGRSNANNGIDSNMLSNVINGSPSNNVPRPTNNGKPRSNSGNNPKLIKFLKPLSSVQMSTGKINNSLKMFKAGRPSHNGNVNSANPKFNKLSPSLMALLKKLKIGNTSPVRRPANNGRPNNNSGRSTKALLNNFKKKIGNVNNKFNNGNKARSIRFLTSCASGYVISPANNPHRRGAIKFLNVSNNTGRPSN